MIRCWEETYQATISFWGHMNGTLSRWTDPTENFDRVFSYDEEGRLTSIEHDDGQSSDIRFEYQYTGDGVRYLKKDHVASKEYRYGCSIDCGGTPMRVYERTLGSQGSWTSVEDYLQAGSALWYGENQLVNHGQDKVALMTSEADPIGFERADSNGMPIQAELEPCLCIAFSAGVCGPSLEGCASPCDEMPKLLPPGKGNDFSMLPLEKSFHQFTSFGTITIRLNACALHAESAGRKVFRECKRQVNNHKHCDKMGHCMASCVTRKCGTRLFSQCVGWMEEIKDHLQGRGADPLDIKANIQGEKCAKSRSGCLKCCLDVWAWTWF